MRIGVRDTALFFDVEGAKLVPDGPRLREKPTLLLLHGGPGFDHSGFKPAFSELAADAQVVYLDHRGNGRSDRGDPGRWTLAEWADDVRAFCDALAIERPVVLGQSFGGMVAMATPRDPDANRRTEWNFDVMFRFGGGEDQTANLLPDLARVRCKTLVLAGEDDPITPVEDALDIAAALPPACVRLVRFPGCGHGVFRDDRPAAFAEIRRFLAEPG